MAEIKPNRDWNRERFVTGEELMELPSYTREWFAGQPNIWRSDPSLDLLVNCAHPDNRDWMLRDLIASARARR